LVILLALLAVAVVDRNSKATVALTAALAAALGGDLPLVLEPLGRVITVEPLLQER
jgi:predicted cation transporter